MHLILALGLARGLHMAGAYAVFGTTLMLQFARPDTVDLSPRLRRLAWVCLALALATGAAWFVLQSADMASAGSIGDTLAALPVVAQATRFGHLLVLRGLALIAACLCLQRGRMRGATLLAGLAVVAEAWLGHGGAMPGRIGMLLLLTAIIHLGSGAAWIGSLPALFLMIAALPRRDAAGLARRYSPFGAGCVLAITGSAVIQYVCLIGSLSALLGSAYGRIALLKISLLGALILLALLNRYRLAPALHHAADDSCKTHLLYSIGFEICLGMLAVLAAGYLLACAPPAMAMS